MTSPPISPAASSRRGTWSGLSILAGVLAFVFGWLSVVEIRYARGAVRVPGVVLEKIFRAPAGNKGSSTRRVEYRFTTKEGKAMEGHGDTLPGVFKRLEVGGPVEIEYLARFPGTNRVVGSTASLWTYGTMTLLLLSALAVFRILARRAGPPIPPPPAGPGGTEARNDANPPAA